MLALFHFLIFWLRRVALRLRKNVSLSITILFYIFTHCASDEEHPAIVIETLEVSHVEKLTYNFVGIIDGMPGMIDDHGFCWDIKENPDINSSKVNIGSKNEPGQFHAEVSELQPTTTYYVRAFAFKGNDLIYGNIISFETTWDPEFSVKDIDGNIYKTVRVGAQMWMAENLRTTRYADEEVIRHVKTQQDWWDLSDDSKAYCYYNNDLNLGYQYGALYSWPAASRHSEGNNANPSGIQGVCPTGWHLPSDSEWMQLEQALGMKQSELEIEGWRGEEIGNLLKQDGTQFWEEPNSNASNSSEFEAVPGGYRHGSGEFLDIGKTARFWTSTSDNNAWFRQLDHDHSEVFRGYSGVFRGHSVRCVKD